MPRWDRKAVAGKNGKQWTCYECGAAVSTEGSLKASANEGKHYCSACWDAWYHRPHTGTKHRNEAREPITGGHIVINGQNSECESPEVKNGGTEVISPHNGSIGNEDDGFWETTLIPSDSNARETIIEIPAQVSEIPPPVEDKTETLDQRALPSTEFERQVAGLRTRYVVERTADAEEQQIEEIETLRAIYGEALEVLVDKEDEPRIFRLELPTDLETGMQVEIAVSTPDGVVVVGVVEALPPLVLCCALPAQYPETEQPIFTLEAEHLKSMELDTLREELQRLASENLGQPILFLWTSALQEREPLSAQLLLGPSASGGVENMENAFRLLAYDRNVRDERRNREMHRCPVCFDEVLGSRGIFLKCGHFACRDCLQQMAQIYTGEADLSSLKCPCQGCGQAFSQDDLANLLGADSEVLARWQELSLRRCFDTMKDVTFCPRCDANGEHVPCIEDEDRMATCEVCGFVFCGKCRCVFHPGTKCADLDDQMWALEQRARGQGRAAEMAQAELLTLRHLHRTTRNCPKCSTTIEKTEGCNKMKCKTCGVYFCWKCSKEISGYDHFATSECRLFDDEEIRRWNQQMRGIDRAAARAHEARFLAQFIDQNAEDTRRCPRCRNVVAREGRNNHLRCHACQTPFCAKCMEILPNKNAGEHFNRKGSCPQHSD